MDAPPVQYVKTSDGYDIAYAVSGSGEPLVVVGTGYEHVQLSWQMPGLEDWLVELAAHFKLIQLDCRGAGMSTRGLPDGLRMDDYQRDIQAVVDSLKLDRFILYGSVYHLSYFAVQYAVEHPNRVKALILVGVGTSLASYSSPALFDTVAGQNWDLFWSSLVAFNYPDSSLEERQRVVELNKQAYDPHDFPLMAQVGASTSLTSLLQRVAVPTLVLYPRDFHLLAPEEPMKVARQARAKLVAVDGRSPYRINTNQGLRAIENFLTDLPAPSGPSARQSTPAEPPSGLSEREVEVLRLLAQGKSNPQIAQELFITRNTVQNHVSSILIKLNRSNRAQAAVYAKEQGIV